MNSTHTIEVTCLRGHCMFGKLKSYYSSKFFHASQYLLSYTAFTETSCRKNSAKAPKHDYLLQALLLYCTCVNRKTKARYAILLTTQQTSCATYVHIVVHLFNDTAITLFWFVSFLTRSAGSVTPNSREFFSQIFSYNHKWILAVTSAVINGLVNGAICGQWMTIK